MKKALIVLDCQRGIINQGEFLSVTHNISKLITHFEQSNSLIVFFQHVDYDDADSPLYYTNTENLKIVFDTKNHIVLNKSEPSAFQNSAFKRILAENNIDHLIIVGFNTEYCCLFTAINAQHEGFKVSFIEDAAGTVNKPETYDMEGLDIDDFIGSILNWSNCIEVLYYEEFKATYG